MSGKLPIALLDSLEHCTGFDRDAFVAVHEAAEKITSIRLNPAKPLPEYPALKIEVPFAPQSNPTSEISKSEISSIPWHPHGYYLPQRPSFTLDPLFHAGTYYVQEASSMFLHEVLKQVVGSATQQRVLDLCAAPGGKSTLLACYFPEGLLIANEVIRTRSSILAENTTKWGADNIVVTNNDPAHFRSLENYFDVMVVDAPCSGSGLFRKDAGAIEEWSEDNVTLCSQRQQRILADVYPALKQDGVLIYSTCSYSSQEDEEILDWLMKEFALESCALNLQEHWGIIPVTSPQHKANGYRFYPDKLKGEGFFIAAFRKKDGSTVGPYVKKNTLTAVTKQETAVVENWLQDTSGLFFFKQKDTIIAVKEQWRDDIAILQQSMHIRKAGVAIGELKGKDLVPEHALALSLLIKETIPELTLELEEALQYLRKKEVQAGDAPKGWTIVKYKGARLGWIKVLQGRVNNYYPVEWRILKD